MIMIKYFLFLFLFSSAVFADCTYTVTAPTANTDGSALIDLTSYSLTVSDANGVVVDTASFPATSNVHIRAVPGADPLMAYTASWAAVNSGGLESAPVNVIFQVSPTGCPMLGTAIPNVPGLIVE